MSKDRIVSREGHARNVFGPIVTEASDQRGEDPLLAEVEIVCAIRSEVATPAAYVPVPGARVHDRPVAPAFVSISIRVLIIGLTGRSITLIPALLGASCSCLHARIVAVERS